MLYNTVCTLSFSVHHISCFKDATNIIWRWQRRLREYIVLMIFFCIDCSLKVTFLWDKSRFWTTEQDRKLVLSRERKDISRDHLPQDSKTETTAASGHNDYHPVTSKTTSLSVRTLICMRSEPTGPQRMPYPLPATQSEHTLKSAATSETVLLISAQRSTQSNPGSWLEPPRALC